MKFLELGVFDQMSEWYYDATLELAKVCTGKFTSAWVAKKLEIHPIQAQKAIDDLRKMGFIGGTEAPECKLYRSSNITPPEIEEASAKSHQLQLLDLSAQA
ncbi:MAG: DUF4423 domain-containing protein, partial [Bdellovibrionales bacterium]|nr:DUF4423 domain-containing protein [Bdellovibrionales bacterium]